MLVAVQLPRLRHLLTDLAGNQNCGQLQTVASAILGTGQAMGAHRVSRQMQERAATFVADEMAVVVGGELAEGAVAITISDPHS